jgi:AcrR family transcriptional regulator
MAVLETKTQILDAAERLFAARGFGDVSLRQIIGAAGVNLAAVHYHYGSKEALFREVVQRRMGPLNRERLDRLDEAQRQAGRRPASLEKILEAMIAPALRLSRDPRRGGEQFMRLLGRTLTDPDDQVQAMLLDQVKEVADRFKAAFRRALPGLPVGELFWRLHFSFGSMAHTLVHTQHIELLSEGLCDPRDTEGLIDRLVTFAAAGLRAPLPRRRKKGARP